MKIQVICYNENRQNAFTEITVSPMEKPKSLDEFDINVIDLTSEDGLWCNNKFEYSSINSIKDFESLSSMVGNTKRTKILYVFPSNVTIYYGYDGFERKLQMSILLKDCLDTVCRKILSVVLPCLEGGRFLAFENTRTFVSGKLYEADFYFGSKSEGITRSELSEKITSIAWNDRVYGTTLNIMDSQEKLLNYLGSVFGGKEKSDVPIWMKDIVFLDDKTQLENIDENEKIIIEAKECIIRAQGVLDRNFRYKSILYTNSDELVEVVFEILERLLGCDLSQFEDVRREDFLIKTDNCTFIGEIKGVTSNIKYEHVSQVELHYRGYLDRMEEEGLKEKVKQILIMNPFRTKPLDKREPVCEDQIKLAERNECLIVETNTLLRVFEKFCSGEIDVQKCIDVFSNEVGLLSVDAFT